jgi:hypothetical protein
MSSFDISKRNSSWKRIKQLGNGCKIHIVGFASSVALEKAWSELGLRIAVSGLWE